MPSRGRSSRPSQSNIPRVSQGSRRRASSSRGPGDPFTSLRRSTRLLDLLAARESGSQEATARQSEVAENDSQIWSAESVARSEPSRSINQVQAAQDPGPSQQITSSRPCNRADNELGAARPCVNGVINSYSTALCNMNILIEPPNQIRPGHLLNPPLILRLDQPPSDQSDRSSTDDPTLLWAVVSILPADAAAPVVHPQPDLLLGTPVDSVHPLTPEMPGRELGFVSFTDLAIREPGRYRLQISLIRMNALGPSNAPSFEGGTNMLRTFTRIIHVDPEAETPSLG